MLTLSNPDSQEKHRETFRIKIKFAVMLYLYFICHTIITKNIEKEEKKKWRRDLAETIEAYERLGLLEP